jgi:uncharacterized membrane protein
MCFLKSCYSFVATLCVLSPLFCAAQKAVVSSEPSYLSFAVPGALGTYPMTINDSQAVTGYYYVSSTVTRGFLRDADGEITSFDVLGGVWTEPESINAAGEITGFYKVVAGVPQGFLRYADGRIITFDPPCNGVCNISVPVGINAYGEIAGNYPFLAVGASAGFSRSRAGDFTTIRYSQGAEYPTAVSGLNSSGTIVGSFSDFNYAVNATSFLLQPDGFSIQFSVPLDEEYTFETTVAEGINDDGVIAGWYGVCFDSCVKNSSGGFVRSPGGEFTVFNPPGTLVTLPELGPVLSGESLSAPHRLSINAAGDITGSYTDAGGAQHGFVRNPYGTITSFDPPKGRQTTATSINDSGVIAGYYYHANAKIAEGFLRVP